MRRLLPSILLLFTLLHTAGAQIELQWRLENNKTLAFEPIRATLAITNHSGETLNFSPYGNAALTFDVENQPSHRVLSNGRPLIANSVIIPDGEGREITVNLLTAYSITRVQHYSIAPRIEFSGLAFTSPKTNLEVLPGTLVTERDYGMPGDPGGRTIILRTLNRNRAVNLFFRMDDRQNHCLGVYDLGTCLRTFTPRIEQDAQDVFHVFHQAQPHVFVHTTFDTSGRRLNVNYYQGEASQMRMQRNASGAISIIGGEPFVAAVDRPGYVMPPGPPPANTYPTTLPQREKPSERKSSWWRRSN